MHKEDVASARLYRRAAAFLAESPLGPTTLDLTPVVARLAETSERLDATAIEQEQCKREARAATAALQAEARRLRMEFIRPVARAVRTLLPRQHPARRALLIPRDLRRYDEIVQLAHTVGGVADQHPELLQQLGFVGPVGPTLREAAQQVVAAQDRRARAVARLAGVTARLRSLVAQGQAEVMLIDAVIEPALEGDEARARGWRAVRRRVKA